MCACLFVEITFNSTSCQLIYNTAFGNFYYIQLEYAEEIYISEVVVYVQCGTLFSLAQVSVWNSETSVYVIATDMLNLTCSSPNSTPSKAILMVIKINFM